MLSPYFSLEGGDVVVEFTQRRGNHPLPAVSGYGASPDGETSVTVSILGELVPAESGYLSKPPLEVSTICPCHVGVVKEYDVHSLPRSSTGQKQDAP